MSDNVPHMENAHIIEPADDPDRDVLPSGYGRGLPGRQLTAIPVIVSSATIRQAARTLEVSERTIYRWLEDPDFRDELDRQREEAASLALQELRGLLSRTVAIYAESMEDPNPAIRLRAARYASTLGVQLHETQKLRAEIEVLEQALAEWKSKSPLP